MVFATTPAPEQEDEEAGIEATEVDGVARYANKLRLWRFLIFVLFCLNGCLLKEGSGYPIRDFASLPGTERIFLLP